VRGGLYLLGRRLGSRRQELVVLVLCRGLFLGLRLSSGIGGLNEGFWGFVSYCLTILEYQFFDG
jgi:hypothetical protein